MFNNVNVGTLWKLYFPHIFPSYDIQHCSWSDFCVGIFSTIWYELQVGDWPITDRSVEATIWLVGSNEGIKKVLAEANLGKEVTVSLYIDLRKTPTRAIIIIIVLLWLCCKQLFLTQICGIIYTLYTVYNHTSLVPAEKMCSTPQDFWELFHTFIIRLFTIIIVSIISVDYVSVTNIYML